MNFSETLQLLFQVSNVKLASLAQYLGYDVSYISKWINGNKLPSSRNIEELIRKINRFIGDNTSDTQRKKIAKELELQRVLGKEIENKEELLDALSQALLHSFERQKGRREEKKRIPEDISYDILWQDRETAASAIGEMIYEICTRQDRGVDIIVTYPFQEYGDENCDFFSRLRTMEQFHRNIRIHQLVDMKEFGKNLELYCKCICRYLTNIYSVKYHFYEMDPQVGPTPVLLVKNELLVTDIVEPFTGKSYLLVVKNIPVVNAYYEAATAYLQSKKRMIMDYSEEMMQEEKYIYDYMMRNEYRYILHSMHLIHLPEDMLMELCRELMPDEEQAMIQYNMNKNSFDSPITAFIYKATLMDYIFEGKLNIFGNPVVVEKEWRIRHIRHLIEQLKSNEQLKLYLLDNNNPYIGYDELKSSLYFCSDTIFSMYWDEDTVKYSRFFSEDVILCFNRFFSMLEQAEERYVVRGQKVIEFLEQGLKFIK